MTVWHPDTCECEIEYTDSFENSKILKCCKFHENKTANDVLNHNRSFNRLLVDKSKKLSLKSIEKQRIKSL